MSDTFQTPRHIVAAVRKAATHRAGVRLPDAFDDKSVRQFVRSGAVPETRARYSNDARDGRRVSHEYGPKLAPVIIEALLVKYGATAVKTRKAATPRKPKATPQTVPATVAATE